MPDYDVLVSYARADSAWVHKTLLPRLETGGLCVFDEGRDLQPGTPRAIAPEKAARESAVCANARLRGPCARDDARRCVILSLVGTYAPHIALPARRYTNCICTPCPCLTVWSSFLIC
jgi:hypothetical protein